MATHESALVVPVPEAEFAVSDWRRRLDPAAVLGVPAHVTVLYPFVDPSGPLDAAVRRLRTLLATVPRFRYEFEQVGWFGEDVVWLAPEPDEGFRTLTELVSNAWPDLLPYGGIHDDVIPHLTIGDGAPPAEMQVAARGVGRHLPIAAIATEVWLMAGSDRADSWRLRERFALGS